MEKASVNKGKNKLAEQKKKDVVNPKIAQLESEIKKHEFQQEQLNKALAHQEKVNEQRIAANEKAHKDAVAKIKEKIETRQDAIDAAKAELKSL